MQQQSGGPNAQPGKQPWHGQESQQLEAIVPSVVPIQSSYAGLYSRQQQGGSSVAPAQSSHGFPLSQQGWVPPQHAQVGNTQWAPWQSEMAAPAVGRDSAALHGGQSQQHTWAGGEYAHQQVCTAGLVSNFTNLMHTILTSSPSRLRTLCFQEAMNALKGCCIQPSIPHQIHYKVTWSRAVGIILWAS